MNNFVQECNTVRFDAHVSANHNYSRNEGEIFLSSSSLVTILERTETHSEPCKPNPAITLRFFTLKLQFIKPPQKINNEHLRGSARDPNLNEVLYYMGYDCYVGDSRMSAGGNDQFEMFGPTFSIVPARKA